MMMQVLRSENLDALTMRLPQVKVLKEAELRIDDKEDRTEVSASSMNRSSEARGFVSFRLIRLRSFAISYLRNFGRNSSPIPDTVHK